MTRECCYESLPHPAKCAWVDRAGHYRRRLRPARVQPALVDRCQCSGGEKEISLRADEDPSAQDQTPTARPRQPRELQLHDGDLGPAAHPAAQPPKTRKGRRRWEWQSPSEGAHRHPRCHHGGDAEAGRQRQRPPTSPPRRLPREEIWEISQATQLAQCVNGRRHQRQRANSAPSGAPTQARAPGAWPAQPASTDAGLVELATSQRRSFPAGE